MDFREAERYLYSFVDWEKKGGRPSDFRDLGRFRAFLKDLGNPQEQFRTALVVGTNGKGSVSALLAGILGATGKRVGLFTSPHLVSVRERIQIHGTPISETEFAEGIHHLSAALSASGLGTGGYRTTFELLTALAFWHFRAHRVDVAVIEAGLGGRLDATAVVEPSPSIITSIHLDHTATLGSTLAEVTRDKSGAIRTGSDLITAPQPRAVHRVIEEEVRRKKPSLWLHVGRDLRYRSRPAGDGFFKASFMLRSQRFLVARVPLRGRHQVINTAVAIAAATAVEPGIDAQTVERGLGAVRWPGRLEIVRRQPAVLLDGAHNPHAARTLARFIQDFVVLHYPRIAVLIAISKGKNIAGILSPLAKLSCPMISCNAEKHRGFPAEELYAAIRETCASCFSASSPGEGLEIAEELVGRDGLVVACGSLYLVGLVAKLVHADKTWWAAHQSFRHTP